MRTILGILGVLAIAFLLGLGSCTFYRTGSLPRLQSQVDNLEGKVNWLTDDAKKKDQTATKNHNDEMAAIAAVDACKCNVPAPKPRPVVRRRSVPPPPAPTVQLVCPVNCPAPANPQNDRLDALEQRTDRLEQRVGNVEEGQKNLHKEIESSKNEILKEIKASRSSSPPAPQPPPAPKKHWWNHNSCQPNCRS
jgi:hypothetical protein